MNVFQATSLSRNAYGFIVVSSTFLMMVVLWGVFYSYGVFFQPILSEFGWTRAAVSGAFSLCSIIFGLTGIVIGGLNDRFGPRLVMTFCGIFMASAYMLMSRLGALWHLYLFYGVILGIGMSGSFVPIMTTVARWFDRTRGMMTGIVTAGIGIGALVGPPATEKLIAGYGWRNTYALLGAIVLAVMVLCAQVLRRDPSVLAGAMRGALAGGDRPSGKDVEGMTLREAVRTREFWMYAGVIFCFGYCVFSVMVHIAPHAVELGISPAGAARVLATIGGMSILGKIVLGKAADTVGNRKVFILGFAFMAATLLLLTAAEGMAALLVFAAAYGVAYGGCVTVESPMVAVLFGLRSHGLILGFVALGFTVGGSLGPWLTGRAFDATGSYRGAFLTCAGLSVAALALLLMIQVEKDPR